MGSVTEKLEKLNHQAHFDPSGLPIQIQPTFHHRAECARRILKGDLNMGTREAHFDLLDNYNNLIRKYFAI